MGEQQGGDKGRRKIENFKLQIADEDLELDEEAGGRLSSYSKPPLPENTADQEKRTEEEKIAKKAHKKRNKEKRKNNRRFFRLVWFFMVVLVAISLSQYLITGVNDMLAVSRIKQDITVEIPSDATTEQISKILKDYNIIGEPNFFKLYAKVTKAEGKYRGGKFELSTDMDYEALINTLQSNAKRASTKVTIPEGTNVLDFASKLTTEGVLTSQSKEEFLKLCNSNEFDEDFSFLKDITNGADRYYKLEGYLFPDTYEFYLDQKPNEVIEKILSTTNKKLDEELRKKAGDKGLTVDQVLILASMVQREAANAEQFPDDMAIISSVFQNRLASETNEGFLLLNSDPTIFYPYSTPDAAKEAEGEGFTGKYDTYKVKGLPAGAICNPGMAAIKAVLEPKSTQYYYFCHDPETQQPYYAKTEAQHEQNKKKAGLA